jgi:ketosteroid isomerase-like protein
MNNAVSLLAFPCLLILSCCQQSTKLPENYQAQVCEELSQLGAKYFTAWDNENLDSVMLFLDKDFINMFSYGPATNFQENNESFKSVFDTYSVEGVKYERIECIVDHTLAFETGLFEQKWISNDTKDTISFRMRGISVWRMQEDGSWKMFRLIGQQ